MHVSAVRLSQSTVPRLLVLRVRRYSFNSRQWSSIEGVGPMRHRLSIYELLVFVVLAFGIADFSFAGTIRLLGL
jgi:hypothetical protein